ncbi:hypothetical protein T459_16781 [Capsicum annuum]|uniref:Uncharacterized protein n=1 Tax=Capsicum annuum TaxID=4072 RepID=A0A2G2Z9T9_CAPAN|nr:hypothetical protein T459_16781 [Capsicum annuum]
MDCGTHFLQGHRLTKAKDIQEEIIGFYKSQMGSSNHILPTVNLDNMKKGNTLTYDQGLALIRGVTIEEIVNALKSIANHKALGLDGYNAHFYKKTWHIIQHDLLAAVKEFFATGKMYKLINYTLITLVLKTTNPNNMKKFWPIACCYWRSPSLYSQ